MKAGVHGGLTGSFFSFVAHRKISVAQRSEQSSREKKPPSSGVRCSRFRSAPPPLSDFGEKTSGIVRCCSLHENLQVVSAEILIAALSHSQLPQEPHISRMPKTGLSRYVLGWSVRTVSPGGTSRNGGSGTCPAAAPSRQRFFHVGGQSQMEIRVIA